MILWASLSLLHFGLVADVAIFLVLCALLFACSRPDQYVVTTFGIAFAVVLGLGQLSVSLL